VGHVITSNFLLFI